MDRPNPPGNHAAAAASIAAVALLIGIATPRAAEASKGEFSLQFAGMLANANATSEAGAQFGPAVRGSAVVDVSDFWSLHFGGGAAHHFVAKPGDRKLPALDVRHAFAGFRYNIDVFRYVPWIGFSAATYLPGPPSEPKKPQRSTVGAILSAGVDWRFDRYWSLGVVADLHAVSLRLGGFPNYSAVGLNLGYHFRL